MIERLAFAHASCTCPCRDHPNPLTSSHLCVLNNGGLETLRVLDVDSLDVAVELLLGALLVVTLSRDAHAQSEWNTLDTGLPDLLVQLWVEADILGALRENMSANPTLRNIVHTRHQEG